MKEVQGNFDLGDARRSHKETLNLDRPLTFSSERTAIGELSRTAMPAGSYEFDALPEGELHRVTNTQFGVSFLAKLREGTNNDEGTYDIKGEVQNIAEDQNPYQKLNLAGKGHAPDNFSLRPAQLGAVHSLMAHWSLSGDPATVVLPTGTGKTETMLTITLLDNAKKVLVIVPSDDLRNQLTHKFATWGLLRELGVIPQHSRNPVVLKLKHTIRFPEHLDILKQADVIVSTPGLIANAPVELQKRLKDIISHVFFDEAHHIVADTWSKIKSLFLEKKVVQFTATPYRNDRKPIEGKIVYNYPLSKALDDECFSKISLVAVNERDPRYKDRAIADKAIERLREDRKNGFTRHKMMVRVKNKSQATTLFELYQSWFPEMNITLVHSGVQKKKQTIEDILNGKYDIVVCVDMLKEGFDFPDFKIAAVHGIHKSMAVLLQFIGRFTRHQHGLGDASFVVNYSDETISSELEELLQEGSGWELVIKEIADEKKQNAETLLDFLQGCQPLSGFDDPDVTLNPKLVFPALSFVCFNCESVDWTKFHESFSTSKYALSQPYFNKEENVFYFSTQKRDKVSWARSKKIKDQKWDLFVMHHDPETKLLYIGYSEKKPDLDGLVSSIAQGAYSILNKDCVFRVFDSIMRLSIIHAGIFKPANHLHRYSRLSGPDVSTELSRWKEGNRCEKSDFVGVGFRNGEPVNIGASAKGKIWSPSKSGNILEWKQWCLEMGRLITNENIDADQLLEDSAKKIDLKDKEYGGAYPSDMVILAADWADALYTNIYKLILEVSSSKSYLLSECSLKYEGFTKDTAKLIFILPDGSNTPFSIVIGGEKGHSVQGLEKCIYKVAGLKRDPVPLAQFFQEQPPTLFLIGGDIISGCVYTKYNTSTLASIPDDQIQTLEWQDVDFTKESLYKSHKPRLNSIQQYMMDKLKGEGASIVFNDDNSGESADIVAVFEKDKEVLFKLVHCKYSKAKAGSRLSDLYEVCGQAIVSLRYKWRPEDLVKHLERRNSSGVLKGKRFYHGDLTDLNRIKASLKYKEIHFEFAIAQPGVSAKALEDDMKNLLGSVYSTAIDMTETKMKCYFSR